jgi:pimeloyl-ACP methyl ester carboxylesterase
MTVATGVGSAQATAVEESRFQTIGGSEQWITIRGTDRRNPVLFILHGGPGDAQSQFVSTYAPLERDFVVVQWDQRGGGKTLERAGSSQSTSLEQLTRDGIELAVYLRRYLDTSNVILVGHSWGSFLGVHIVKRRPDLFRGFVGTGQVVRWNEMVQAQHRYTLDRARADANAATVAELEALGVPASDNFDQYLIMRRRLNGYLAPADQRWLGQQDALLRAALAPEVLRAYRQGFQTMTGLSSTVFSMDLPSLGFEFKLPFVVIQGRDDRIAPASMAADYLQQIDAPMKRLALIDGAGHFALMTHLPQFAAALSESIRLLPK